MPTGQQPNQERLLVADIARLYYEDELTQAQLAEKTGLSQSQVSRLLKEARDLGIVEIRVHHPLRTNRRLESDLKQRLGLEECRVLASDSGAQGFQSNGIPARVGALAARYLQDHVSDHSTIGMGWGSMVYQTVASGYLSNRKGISVVQIQGGVGGPTQDVDGARLVGVLARALGGRTFYLNAPMVVTDSSVRAGLLRDPHIRQTLEYGRRADFLIVGVGAVSPQSGLYRAGYLNDADLEYIRGEGAVGDICGHYFTRSGAHCALEIDDRVVALNVEAMRGVPRRVGVSSGSAKALSNIGAIRSCLINILITDEDAADEMLTLLDAEPDGGEGAAA